MKKKVKWGIIGLGKIANKFATGLKEVKDAELYAVASRNREKAAVFSELHNVGKAYGVYEQLMQDEQVDVIYIATPHALHHQLSMECLKHGKAVLCEKPFAMNSTEAKEMINLAREKNIFLMEALWTMFLPHFNYVLEKINSGQYGKIRSVKADFGFPAEFDKNGRLFNKALGGGSLLDIGIYPVFLTYSLLGKPENIKARAEFSETGIDSQCEIEFLYPKGVTAELKSSIKEKTPTTAVIVLDKATFRLNPRFHEPTSVSIRADGKEEVREFGVKTNGYNFEAEHVTRMLREGRTESDIMSLDRTSDIMNLLDEIRQKIGLEY